jgi:SOS-response transcriptional repressor LexA
MRHPLMARYGVPGLTMRQQLVLTAVADFVRRFGRPPTIREIGDLTSITSTNGVNDHLKALVAKGYLERGENQARALVVLRDADGKPLVSREDEVAKLRARIAELEAEVDDLRYERLMRMGA